VDRGHGGDHEQWGRGIAIGQQLGIRLRIRLIGWRLVCNGDGEESIGEQGECTRRVEMEVSDCSYNCWN